MDARKETFRMLLRHHADSSIKNVQGANALHLAAYNGDLFALNELLFSGRIKSIDDLTSKGATALVLAILQNNVDCVKRLISSGADLNYKFQNDVSPLRLIYSSENPEMKDIYNNIDKYSS